MKLLSIDTTAEICSIAVLSEGEWHVFHQPRPREHAKILLPEIDRLLHEAGVALADIDYIVFGRGPGSFTGVRIAAGVAQGLALSAHCPLLPISTLQSIAYSAVLNGAREIWCALDARMSEIYFASYRVEAGLPIATRQESVLPPECISDAPGEQTVFIGNGWCVDYPMPDKVAQQLSISDNLPLLPDAKHSALLALALLDAKKISSVAPESALPVYLRDKVTWDNKPKIGS